MISLFALPRVGLLNMEYADHLLHGRWVREFEEKWAARQGFKYCVAVGSCTVAITMILSYLRGKSGMMDVTVPAIIPSVVPNAVYHSGARWEWVDDIDWVGHHYVLARKDVGGTIRTVIDSAQSVKRVDMWKGDIVLYSFYPTKPLGGLDGGAICTDDADIAEWCRVAAYNGASMARNSWERVTVMPGWKAYMSSVQALVLLRQLGDIDSRMSVVDDIRIRYNGEFGMDNGSQHLYRIGLPDGKMRELFIADMKAAGIQCGVHYPSLHMSTVWGERPYAHILKSLGASERSVSIPMHHEMSTKDVDLVIEKVKPWLM